jgi:pimeloyl-ACP methyl ester carboxylesterase
MNRCTFQIRFTALVAVTTLLMIPTVHEARTLAPLGRMPRETPPSPEASLVPNLELSPTQGAAGKANMVVARGGQWLAGGILWLYWDGDPSFLLGAYPVGADGSFQGTFTTPTDPPHATVGEHIVVALQEGGLQAEATYELTGPPVVFVHGWAGLGWPGSCKGPDPDKEFGLVDDALKAAGYHVQYAYLVTAPCYTPPITRNIWRLHDAIELAKYLTGHDKVILVAHSMGGLVSRAYVEGPWYGNDVSELFMFGSPHQGVPASVLELLVGRRLLGPYCENLQPVLCQLAYGMGQFNRHFWKRAPGVTYHVISGDAPYRLRDGIAPAAYFLLSGPDDGLVQTASGLGLGGQLDRWFTNEVHGQGSGPRSYFIWKWGFWQFESRSYSQCLEPILVDRTATTCGTVSPLRAETDTPPPLSQRIPLDFGTLSMGQTVTRTIPLEGGPTLFAAHWQTGTLSLALTDPSQQLIDPDYVAGHMDMVTYTADATAATYYFTDTVPGEWQMLLNASTDAPTEGITYTTFAAFDSGIGFDAEVGRDWYKPGATATTTATLSGPPPGALITATVLYADGMSETLSLALLGEGVYGTSFVLPEAPGYTGVRLHATGITSSSLPFERGLDLAFQISPESVAFDGAYDDMPEPRSPGSSFYSALSVGVGINSIMTGTVVLSADLVDPKGDHVVHSATFQDVVSGTARLVLPFDGDEIYASGRDGPYTLTNLLLSDYSGPGLVVDEAEDVYVTAPYSHRSFGRGEVYLPLVLRDQ